MTSLFLAVSPCRFAPTRAPCGRLPTNCCPLQSLSQFSALSAGPTTQLSKERAGPALQVRPVRCYRKNLAAADPVPQTTDQPCTVRHSPKSRRTTTIPSTHSNSHAFALLTSINEQTEL